MRFALCLFAALSLLQTGGCIARSTSLHHADPATRVLYWSRAVGTVPDQAIAESAGWRLVGHELRPVNGGSTNVIRLEAGADEGILDVPPTPPVKPREPVERDDLVEVDATVTRLVPGVFQGEKLFAEDAIAVFDVVNPPVHMRPLRRILLHYHDHGVSATFFKIRQQYTFRFTSEGEFFDIAQFAQWRPRFGRPQNMEAPSERER